jgi:type 1 glutamine amidotransferase
MKGQNPLAETASLLVHAVPSMKRRLLAPLLLLAAVLSAVTFAAPGAAKRKILFFTKSSGFEHSVISWKKGQPSHAEKVLQELGAKNGWEFEFSKDGSKFSKEYLAQFDTVMFYTTGNLLEAGTDGQPPMTAEGKQALFDFVKSGKGFVGTHSASDTFHTNNESKKGPDRYLNHGEQADSYVRFLGGEFIKHGAQQEAKNTVENPKFPGFENIGKDYGFMEEWYSLKDFTPDIHVLSVINNPPMTGKEYERPAYPSTWARKEGDGRVFYTAMGHREDVWTNPTFQSILVGALHWANGDVKAEIHPNLKEVAPQAYTNPPFVEPPPPKPAKK